MFKTTPPTSGRQPTWGLVSLAAHASLLLLLVHARTHPVRVVDRPGDSLGHVLALTYMQGGQTSSSIMRSMPKVEPPRASPPLDSHVPSLREPTPQPARAHGGTQTGETTDALGQGGDIRIAVVLVHPPPKPDLSQLSRGSSGDVVVDIVIDQAGHITDAKLVRGLGPSVDDAVLATIRQWTYTPATRNGMPVSSEQELLFHYDAG